MSYPYTMLVTAVTGNVLAASDYNNEHQNHINNNIPSAIDDDSTNVAAMQATTSPGGVGTESLATSLDGELQRVRYVEAAISGEAQWYVSPGTSLKTLVTNFLAVAKYRRPVLQYSSTTVVNVETGLDGTSGDCTILFPDGTLRTDSDTTRIRMNIAQNAVFNNATRLSNVGGLRTGAVVNNTWYALYAVKVTAGTGATTDFVIVADTVLPTQANYATLNSNFGTNGWVYLGTIRYGDQSASASAIVVFVQCGALTVFQNNSTGSALKMRGVRLATTAGATSLSYSLASGTTGATIPTHLFSSNLLFSAALNPTTSINMQVFDNDATRFFLADCSTGGSGAVQSFWYSGISGGSQIIFMRASNAESDAMDLYLSGYYDSALGVGANPLL